MRNLVVNGLAVLAATTVMGIALPAQAGLFGCGKNCQAKRAAKAAQQQQLQQQQSQPAQPSYDAQQQAVYAQQQAYQAQQAAIAQQQAYAAQQQAQQQYTPPAPAYPSYAQPSYTPAYQTSYGSQDWSSPSFVQNYGTLTNQDWTHFQQNYSYQPSPVMGAVYDRTAYPVSVNEPAVQAIIQGAIAKGGDIDIGDSVVNAALVKNFYALRGYQPAFISGGAITSQAQVARDFFANRVASKGLSSSDYWSKDLEQRFNTPGLTDFQKAGLDLLMVQSLIRLASDLENGRVNPALVDSYVMIKKRPFNDFQALNNAVRPGVDTAAAIESFEPQHPAYKKLEEALTNLYAIKARGGWAKLSGATTLKVGVSSPDIPLLRARLMELNILPYSTTVDPSPIYGADLVPAVKQFQFDNKLKSDGVIGKQGIATLNLSVDYRIMQVRATLEKWRWMPRQLPNRYIMVNIARQEMQVVENGQVVMAMKSVNGQVLRPTNILIDQVVSVDMNPYWNPPPSLILQDIIPGQRADRNHITENHVKLYGAGGAEVDPATIDWSKWIHTSPPGITFREEPGLQNSLGVVKFQTTNSSAIYLHDTNHREFFDNFDERYLSSGCIRLQRPLDLLQYLLRNQSQWSPQAIDQVLSHPNQYVHNVVQLKNEAITFFVFYGTASFDDNGNLRLARDAYHLDERIVRALTPQPDTL